MKYSENLTLLQFKFQIRLQSFKQKIENKTFVEAKHSSIENGTLP
jgi:hypothetical protein